MFLYSNPTKNVTYHNVPFLRLRHRGTSSVWQLIGGIQDCTVHSVLDVCGVSTIDVLYSVLYRCTSCRHGPFSWRILPASSSCFKSFHHTTPHHTTYLLYCTVTKWVAFFSSTHPNLDMWMAAAPFTLCDQAYPRVAAGFVLHSWMPRHALLHDMLCPSARKAGALMRCVDYSWTTQGLWRLETILPCT